MKTILLTLLIGAIAGIIDVLPMIKMKLDKHASLSAFTFYFIMPFIIFNLNLLENFWWIKGAIISLVLSIPTIIIVVKEDKMAILPMTIMAIVLGTFIGVTGYFLGLM
jgi:hypothetical protein